MSALPRSARSRIGTSPSAVDTIVSPATHGFVASISPMWLQLCRRFVSSMKNRPGSPFFHAWCAILLNTSRASIGFTGFPVRGLMRSYFSPFATASMKRSVTATEMLKFVISRMSSLHVMNSRMSGWSTLRIPIFAPRLLDPCLTCCVAASNTFMKDTGPLATPIVDRTKSFFGRSREKLKPVLWTTAIFPSPPPAR